jgi:hypothetical protein
MANTDTIHGGLFEVSKPEAYYGSPYRVRRVWVELKAFVNALERERMACAVAMDFRAVAHCDAPPLSGKPKRLSVDEFKKSSTPNCFS